MKVEGTGILQQTVKIYITEKKAKSCYISSFLDYEKLEIQSQECIIKGYFHINQL